MAEARLRSALSELIRWVIDNHDGESWLDDNGLWRPYTELPEIIAAQEALLRDDLPKSVFCVSCGSIIYDEKQALTQFCLDCAIEDRD